MINYASNNQKEAGVSMATLNKVHFKARSITRNKEGHFMMIKDSIHRGDVILLNEFTY